MACCSLYSVRSKLNTGLLAVVAGGLCMSAGGPLKYCPRCNTALALSAQRCDTCSHQFYLSPGSIPQDTRYGPSPYAGQQASGSWRQGYQGFGYPNAPVAA